MSLRDSMLDLLRSLGVYPLPESLKTVKKFIKSWLVICLLVMFIIVNSIIALKLAILLNFFIITPSLHFTLTKLVDRIFWDAVLYLINKKKIKIIITGVNLNETKNNQNTRNDSKLQELKNSIIISNHRSLLDFVIMCYLKTMVERATGDEISMRFLNWNKLWSTPDLSLLHNILKYDENWEYKPTILEQNLRAFTKKKAFKHDNHWIIHFPEVNIFDQSIHFAQKQQNAENYTQDFNDLLYPRFNNFNNLINIIQKDQLSKCPELAFKYLVDLTILYYDPLKNSFIEPKLLEILSLKQPMLIINIDMKLKPLAKLPKKQRKLEKWLEQDWIEKDKLIEMTQKNLRTGQV